MKTTKKKKRNKISILKVKTGTANDFFSGVRDVMRAADKKLPVKPTIRTLTFEDPLEMLRYLSKAKIALINRIRKQPDSIKNLAKDTHRKPSAVIRDINELEKVGIVRSHSVVNPGHGKHKIIELTASKLTLEASI